jgi:hypothetical protein
MPSRKVNPLVKCLPGVLAVGLLAGCGLDLITKKDVDEPEGPVQVMFIGNSLTGEGDCMFHFEELARAAGHEVVIGQAVKGKASLTDHVSANQTKELIAERQWNYIVLQGSDYLIALPDSLDVVAEPYEILQEIIRNNWNKTRIVLFMDWAMDPMPGGNYTFSEFSQMLHDGYLLLAQRLNCMVAPVGWVWKKVHEERPDLELLKDPIHPNFNGGYLQACVYFAAIFQKSPVGLDYISQLDEEVAEYLQRTAADIVLTHRSRWRLPGS